MELIDKIMSQISDYVTDPMAVSNCLYIAMQDYSITKKTTELTEYVPLKEPYTSNYPKSRTLRTMNNMGGLI